MLGVATVGLSLLPAREPATAAVTLKLPDAKAAALVQATSGAALEDMQAIGDHARVINAALPFANGPLHAAQRFVVSGNGSISSALCCA